jgi:class 3 adenylate cyclase
MWKFDEADYIKRVLGPALDAFKSEGRLPDYFERYDLALTVSDPKEIETAIATVHAYWNKSKQNIRFNRLLSVLLAREEQQDARRNLLDSEARKAVRELVGAERKKIREKRFAALDRSIEVIASKGYIGPGELNDLVARFQRDSLTEDEIKSRVRVPIRESSVRPPISEGLPRLTREQIRSSLAVLQKRDLYDFLGIDRGCSKERLAESLRKRELEWRQKKSDFNLTAANLLLGLIKTHMIDSDPAKYDAALAYEALEVLRPEVRLAAGDKLITKAEFKQLLRVALSHGLARGTAAEYILTLAREYSAAVEWFIDEDVVHCANCLAQVLLKTKAESCTTCGAGLWANCPKCSARVPVDDPACSKCGFKMGMFVESTRSGISGPSFSAWAGGERVVLAIVFTDVAGSTFLGEELKGERMNEVRRAHFAQSRKLINEHSGREIKTIGDSFMATFKSVDKALDYAMALQATTGHSHVQIRAGIHIGQMQVEDNDVFGGTVNFAARVLGAIKEVTEIWLSNQAKEHLDDYGANHHRRLNWVRHDGVEMKGFNGTFTLWALRRKTAARSESQSFASRQSAKRKIVNVCSKGVGVVAINPDHGDREVVYLIHNNTPLPVEMTETRFGTEKANQQGVYLRVMKQAGPVESPALEDNKQVSQGEISGLPLSLPAGSPIHVTFRLAEDGTLNVTAMEPASRRDLKFKLRVEGVMNQEEIEEGKGLVFAQNVS